VVSLQARLYIGPLIRIDSQASSIALRNNQNVIHLFDALQDIGFSNVTDVDPSCGKYKAVRVYTTWRAVQPV